MKGNILTKLVISQNGNEITIKEGAIQGFLDVDICIKAETYSVMMEKFPTGVDRTFSFAVGRGALGQFCTLLSEELNKVDIK